MYGIKCILQADTFLTLLCCHKALGRECSASPFCAPAIGNGSWLNTQKYKFLLAVLTQVLGLDVRLLFFSSFPILLLLHWDNS